MADVDINKFRASVVRDGSKPASPGFVVSEGQDPVNPPGTNNYVPYSGATANVELGEYGVKAGFITLDTTPTNTPTDQGTIYWDVDDETVDIVLNGYTMKIGEDLFYPVKNQTGSTIAKGVAVRFNGTVGNSGRLLIAPFIADGSVPSTRFMGVTAEEILNGEDGKVLYFGRIRGINTNAFNEGDILYASTTSAGGYQTAIPVAPNNIVQVAAVVTKSATVGTIFVRPTLGSNINTDEGVKIVSVADKNLLQYQNATSLWENKSLAQVLGGTSSQFVKGDGSLDSSTYGTGTVTSVGLSSATSGVTIGSSPVTTSGTITLAIATASGSQNGLLSSTDWTTFNSKVSSQWITSGSDIYYSAGNVGINRIPSSGYKLDIQGSTGIRILDNDVLRSIIITPPVSGAKGVISTASGEGISLQATNASGFVTIDTAGLERFKIDSIGTSTFTRSGKSMSLNPNVSALNVDSEIEVTSGMNLFFKLGGSDKFRITSSGNVGIGAPIPTHKLQILGGSDSGLRITNSSGDTRILLNPSGGQHGEINLFNNTGNSTTYLGGNGGNNYLQAQGGNVGIGTNSPDRNLEVETSGDTYLRVTGNRGNADGVHVGNLEFYNSNTSRLVGEIRGITGTGGTQSNSGQLAFYTNDNATYSERMRINSGGNVGINRQIPLYRFHVNTGTNQNFGVRPGTDVGAQNGVALTCSTDDDGFLRQLSLRASDVVMLTSGSVLIGTATALGDAPLQTSGTGTTYVTFNSTSSIGAAISWQRSGIQVGAIGNSGVMGVGILDDLEVRSGSGRGLHLKTDGGKLTLATGGAATFSNVVGINRTPTSGYKLDIQGNEGIRIIDNDVLRSIIITPPNSGASGTISTASGQGISFQATNASGNLTFETAGSEKMRITSGGNVEVSSAGQLKVFRSDNTRSGLFYCNNSAAIVEASTDPLRLSGPDRIEFYPGGTEKMRISSGGVVTITNLGTGTVTSTAGVLSTVSDSSLKVEDGFIDSAIEKVLNLNPRYFYWNEKSGLPTNIRQLGFYAQEVNQALGEEAANTPQNENTPWGICDRSMIAMLTKAIQELKQEIDTLKN